MTLVASTLSFTIFALPCREERTGYLNCQDPSSWGPFGSQELFAPWVLATVVEPFVRRASGSRTSAGITHLRVPKPQMPRFLILYIWQFAFLASFQMKPLLPIWEPQARNYFLSDQPDLSSTNLTWPMGKQHGIKLLKTFQFTPSQFYCTNSWPLHIRRQWMYTFYGTVR